MKIVCIFLAISLSTSAMARRPVTSNAPDGGALTAYLAERPRSRNEIEKFNRGFFEGVLSVSRGTERPDSARTIGINAGRHFRRTKPKLLDLYMVSKGYTKFDKVGSIGSGFEISLFNSDDGAIRAWYSGHIASMEDQKFIVGLPKCSQARLIGYVSPPGSYGHMNARRFEVYSRTVICTSR